MNNNNWGFHNNGFPKSEENEYMVMGRNGSRFSRPKEHQLMRYIPRPPHLQPPLPQPRVMSLYVSPKNKTRKVNPLRNDPRLAARDPRLGSLHNLYPTSKPIQQSFEPNPQHIITIKNAVPPSQLIPYYNTNKTNTTIRRRRKGKGSTDRSSNTSRSRSSNNSRSRSRNKSRGRSRNNKSRDRGKPKTN